jgi:hypothetical protein
MDVWVLSVVAAVVANGPTTLGAIDHSPAVSGEPVAVAVTSVPCVDATSGSPAGELMSNWMGSVPAVVASPVMDVVWLGTKYCGMLSEKVSGACVSGEVTETRLYVAWVSVLPSTK